MKKATPESIDQYIAQFPSETQKALKELRALIKAAAPRVTERISYGIPTFDLNGKYLIYFGCWKQHIGVYPITADMAKEFKEELKPYISGKGSAQFLLDQPVPKGLIRKIVKFRVGELAGKKAKAQRSK